MRVTARIIYHLAKRLLMPDKHEPVPDGELYEVVQDPRPPITSSKLVDVDPFELVPEDQRVTYFGVDIDEFEKKNGSKSLLSR